MTKKTYIQSQSEQLKTPAALWKAIKSTYGEKKKTKERRNKELNTYVGI